MHHAGKQIYRVEKEYKDKLQIQQNTAKESQAGFLCDCLCTTGERVLACPKWSEPYKENADAIFDKLQQRCHPTNNQILYKNHFLWLDKAPLRLFQICTMRHAAYNTSAKCKRREDVKHTWTAKFVSRQLERSKSKTSGLYLYGMINLGQKLKSWRVITTQMIGM